MYAIAAIFLLGAWYVVAQVHHMDGGMSYLLLAAALLSIAMHVLRRSSLT